MKHILATLLAICVVFGLSAQRTPIIQTALVDSSIYVVELIPIEVAQANITAQLAQVNKQIETIEKNMAELVKKRDEAMRQKALLEAALKQLDEASATESAVRAVTPKPPPPSAVPKKKN